MTDDSRQVTTLIKELLVLNWAERTPTLEPPAVKEVEGRKSKRKKIRQELVQVLSLREGRSP